MTGAHVRHRSSRASAAAPQTLSSRFDPRRNSLNAYRLLFASFVIIGHGFHLGPDLPAPRLGSYYIHDIGVDGFFVISGFLITNSRLRSGATGWTYLRDRTLRIVPGYWACLVVCAFVVAPLLLSASARPISDAISAPDSSLGFVLHNSYLVQLQHGVAGMPAIGPVPGTLNGSLWTLFYEFAAYLVVGALAIGGLLRKRPWLLIVAFAICWLALLWVSVSPASALSVTGSPELVPRGSRLGLMFASGALIRVFGHRIPASRRIAVLCLALALGSAPLGEPRLLAAPAFAYLVLYTGSMRTLEKVGQRIDLSYGAYLYAWPIQQLLRAHELQRYGTGFFLFVSFVGAGAAGVLSYVIVERPALRLRSTRIFRRRSAVPIEPGASRRIGAQTTRPGEDAA